MNSLPSRAQAQCMIFKELEAIVKEAGNTIVKAIQQHPVAGLCVFGLVLTSPFLYAVSKGHGLEIEVGILNMKTTGAITQ